MPTKVSGTIYQEGKLVNVDETFDNRGMSFSLGPSPYAWVRLDDTFRWTIYECSTGEGRGDVKMSINGQEEEYYRGTLKEGQRFTASVEKYGSISATWTPPRKPSGSPERG